MTIEEFDSLGWSGRMSMMYKGEQHDIVSVCFVEKLIAFIDAFSNSLSDKLKK